MGIKLLILTVLALLAVVVGLLAGILQGVAGHRVVVAVQSGAMAFAATLTLGLAVVGSLGLM